MPYFFKPLPESDERAPAFARFVVPRGSDAVVKKSAENGWLNAPPDGAVVYREDGELLQGTPAPAKAKAT